jgi:hypothetical protein
MNDNCFQKKEHVLQYYEPAYAWPLFSEEKLLLDSKLLCNLSFNFREAHVVEYYIFLSR